MNNELPPTNPVPEENNPKPAKKNLFGGWFGAGKKESEKKLEADKIIGRLKNPDDTEALAVVVTILSAPIDSNWKQRSNFLFKMSALIDEGTLDDTPEALFNLYEAGIKHYHNLTTPGHLLREEAAKRLGYLVHLDATTEEEIFEDEHENLLIQLAILERFAKVRTEIDTILDDMIGDPLDINDKKLAAWLDTHPNHSLDQEIIQNVRYALLQSAESSEEYIYMILKSGEQLAITLAQTLESIFSWYPIKEEPIRDFMRKCAKATKAGGQESISLLSFRLKIQDLLENEDEES